MEPIFCKPLTSPSVERAAVALAALLTTVPLDDSLEILAPRLLARAIALGQRFILPAGAQSAKSRPGQSRVAELAEPASGW